MSEKIKGGSFLLGPVNLEDVFTPEEFTAEHKLIGKTAADFVANEVEPVVEQLEKMDPELMTKLLKEAGENCPKTAPEKFCAVSCRNLNIRRLNKCVLQKSTRKNCTK